METKLPQDSPAEQELKLGPRGNADWPGWSVVYIRLQRAAHNLGKGRRHWPRCGRCATGCAAPSQDHVDVMAAMASGHEERMKEMLQTCIYRGWLTASDLNETGGHA